MPMPPACRPPTIPSTCAIAISTTGCRRARREDHIAPAKSVLLGSKFFGGPVRFVLSGSGHIAGVVNPPEKQKYQYWTGAKPRNADLEGWVPKAKEHPGSWWPDWLAWLKKQGSAEAPARVPGDGKLKPIEDA